MAIIEVGMAEVKIASSPDVLVTRGLGSCLGIVLYDSSHKIGALNHAMLPLREQAKVKTNPAKFVDSVIPLMINKLKEKGCFESLITVKIFGGAHMFKSIPLDSSFNVGAKNINTAKEILKKHKIKLIGEDVGGNYGRTIFFELETGVVKVKTMFQGRKEL